MLKKTHLTSSSVSSRLNPYSITYGIEELLWHNPVYSQPSFLLYSCHLKIKKNLFFVPSPQKRKSTSSKQWKKILAMNMQKIYYYPRSSYKQSKQVTYKAGSRNNIQIHKKIFNLTTHKKIKIRHNSPRVELYLIYKNRNAQ